MKYTFNVVLWSYIVTLLLYITVLLGMIAQLFLGIIHLMVAAYLYLNYQRLETPDRQRLNFYMALVVFYFLGLGLNESWEMDQNDAVLVTYLFIIPMLIGAYFVWVVHKIRNNERVFLKKNDAELIV